MSSNRSQQAGFNLIELMLMFAIIAVLASAALSLGGSWIQDADINEVEAELTSAIGRAKASGLRNAPAVTGDSAVTAICISETKMLTILSANGADTPDCDPLAGEQVWQAQLDPDVTIFETNLADMENPVDEVTCLCFNNKGLQTNSGECAACSTNSTITLMSGRKDAYIEIY